jgi:hypothetical protein
VTKIIGFCVSPFIDKWTLEGLRALRSVGFTHCRASIDLAKMCLDPDVAHWDFARLDRFMKDLHDADLGCYLNPGGCPSWASEGQPAFVGLIPGTANWNSPHAKRPATPADPPWVIHDGMVLDPFPHGIHYFDQNPNRTDSVHDDLTGELITGSELAAIDQQEPPRPYLVNPPKMSAEFFRTVGRELTARYHPAYIGVGNEYGQEMFNPWVRLDISRDGSVDMIRERLMPEMMLPFVEGIYSADVGDGSARKWKWIGPDADSDVIMRRCDDAWASGDTGIKYDILAGHFYGDAELRGGEPIGYQTTEAFLLAAAGRPLWCSEIAAPLDRLLPWFVKTIKVVEAIFFLGQPWMPTPTIDPARADIAPFVKAFAKINGPVDPPKKALPIPGRMPGKGR